MKRFGRYIPLAAWTVIITVSMVLSKMGVIPPWVFYSLLIIMHVWIFTKIGIRIYKLKHKYNEKENCCR